MYYQNEVTGTHSATINGKPTGLAGCTKNATCDKASDCLRANEALAHREDMNPNNSLSCRYRIPTVGAKTTKVTQVLYSPAEFDTMDGRGYWSKRRGWTTIDKADRLTPLDAHYLNLPQSLCQDRQWIDDPELSVTASTSVA
ncbi:hypothetical protein [Marinobacter sp. ELB17]|uniref:hypothetical protein n=1 Tax=Marinobacter sp. ELB17 TaxID=270374 RepID=UPI0000F360A6|nr:hypothetical protein [Marinobacter sp. ELB17]EAZ97016.1 hypothetical protein MELB17_09473 [Marinobacter sp. ELB17]